MSRLLVVLLLLLPLHSALGAHEASTLERTARSVVALHDTIDAEDSYCTAFAIGDHQFLSAAHCIGALMVADGVQATVVKQDNVRDLALITAALERPALTLRNKSVHLYEEMTGLGFAFDMPFLSAIGVVVLVKESAPKNSDIYPGVWYSGVFLNGMSGGPIVDKDGQVVGVVQRAGVGTSYGVSVKTIKEFLAR